MNISKSKLSSFVRELVDEYNEESVLSSISNLERYDQTRHKDLDYIQLGRRINLPKDFFYENSVTHTAGLPTRFIRSVTASEENFILSSIDESVEEDRLDTYSVDEFSFESLIVESFEYVYEADHIYIPNTKEYRMKFHEWVESGRAKYEGRHQYVLGASEIEVKWMPSSWGFNDAFIFNSDDIIVVQKRYSDSGAPDSIEHLGNIDIAKKDDEVMVYIGQHPEENDEFEFFYRVILSKPRFTGYSPYAATIARLPSLDS